jgi:hypothetical protein
MLDFMRPLLLPSPQSVKFILVAIRDEGSALSQFGLEPSPHALFVLLVLVLEQAEGFLGGKLGNSCEIPDTQSVKNFSPF